MLSEILIPDANLPHTCKADTPISSFHISFPFLFFNVSKLNENRYIAKEGTRPLKFK